MKLNIERVKGGIDVHRVINADADVEATLDNHYAFRIDRKTEISDFLRHLLTNAVFVHRSILRVASNALNFLLELILLDVWGQYFPGQIEKGYNEQNPKQCFKSLHGWRPQLLRDLAQFISNFGHRSIGSLACRALYELNLTFGNLLANIDSVRDSH